MEYLGHGQYPVMRKQTKCDVRMAIHKNGNCPSLTITDELYAYSKTILSEHNKLRERLSTLVFLI